VNSRSISGRSLKWGFEVALVDLTYKKKSKHPRCVKCGRFLNTESPFSVSDVCSSCSDKLGDVRF
jgi:hypothetical protein